MNRSLDSLRAFVAGPGRPSAFRARPGVVVLGAGKGGVGTSVVSAVLAVGAARAGEVVLLVDGDESVGSLHLLLGVADPGPGLGALRGGRAAPEELLRAVAPGLTLLAGGGGGVDGTLSAATAERRALLRRVADLYDRYTLVVVDGGSRLESVMAACGAGVERLLCVTGPGRIALAASYALFKVTRARFEALPVELVVNGTGDGAGRGLHAVVRRATQSFLATDVRLAGIVPTDPELALAVESGRPLQSLPADRPAMAAAADLAARVLAERGTGVPLAPPPARVIPLR